MANQYTIETLTDPRFNDVVLWEEFVGAGTPHSRDVVTVNAAAGGTWAQGTVLYRALGKSATATWDKLTADSQVATTNEYAILIGSDQTIEDNVTFVTTTSKKAIAIVRRAHIKEKVSKDIAIAAGVSAGEWANLKRLLAVQGVIVSDTLTAITA